jgi:hypothetical protein
VFAALFSRGPAKEYRMRNSIRWAYALLSPHG